MLTLETLQKYADSIYLFCLNLDKRIIALENKEMAKHRATKCGARLNREHMTSHFVKRCLQFEEAFMSVVNLTRYENLLVGDLTDEREMIECATGSYVKFEDVVELLKQTNNKQSAPCSHCAKFPAGETTLGWKWCPWCGRKL